MHILCTICSDLVNQAENIIVTKCGHIFHNHCLSQWIARSKTCPQCRNKVTDRCMFRIYPTISNETTLDDATTLQSRLDDAHLQLRQTKVMCKEKEDKLAAIAADLKKNEELLKSYEKKIVTRDSAVSALKEQLEYVKIQNLQTTVLKTENENLKKNLQTLNGLQKVLNATADDVENMLQNYSDVNTIATFATALKRALCESETKLKQTRDKLQIANRKANTDKQTITELQAKIVDLEDKLSLAEHKYEAILRKRKSSETDKDSPAKVLKLYEESNTLGPSSSNIDLDMRRLGSPHLNDAILNISGDSSLNMSFETMVKKIENSDSPYLQLKQSSLPLAALQQRPQHLTSHHLKPSELALMNTARNAAMKSSPLKSQTSIFHRKPTPKLDSMEDDVNLSKFDISFDGLGGHSKLDTFPVPKPKPLANFIPKLTSKHKLKRPNPAGSQDIGKMLGRLKK